MSVHERARTAPTAWGIATPLHGAGIARSHTQRAASGPLTGPAVHPTFATHRSLVQGSPSSQRTGLPPTQEWLAHVAPVVHGSLRQSRSSLQHPATPACVHPIVGSQASWVHGSPSLQAIEVWTHPRLASQESAVQAFPSSQSTAAPPRHVPPVHLAPCMQASRSQAASLVQQPGIAVWVQPVVWSQASAVHGS
jgi:hypothetical protein